MSLLDEISKEEFEGYYYTHNNNDVCKKFGIKKHSIKQLLKKFGLPLKTKEQVYAIISSSISSKSDEEKVAIEQKRQQTCLEKYGCVNPAKDAGVRQKISKGISKLSDEDKHLKVEKFKQTMASKTDEEKETIRRHRSEATKKYFDEMTDEEREAFSQKMSEVYHNLPEEVKEERKKKIVEHYKENCIKKYGVTNTLKLDSVREKVRKTCEERYGVPYFCMHQSCRSALGGNASDTAPNRAFAKLLDENGIEYTREFPLGQYSYDFKVGNILIEIDPSATHNSTWSPFGTPHDKSYHYSKSVCAEQNGFRCIHIFDWDDYEKILMLLESGTREVIYARNCTIGDVSESEAREFINKYHLQGYAKDSIRIGLYCGDRLVSIMTFGKPRYNKHFDYELIRYCSCANVVGGAEKLFKYFIKEHSNCNIISYCDYAKFSGDLYEKLGFKNKGCSVSKHWYELENGMHITDNLLRQRGFDQLFGTDFGKGTSNEELMIACGFVEVYDCGQIRFEYGR